VLLVKTILKSKINKKLTKSEVTKS
jgi:hypothetical protein